MNGFLEFVWQQLRDHGIKLLTAAAFTGVGWTLGRWRARKTWERREFYDRLNVSLNIIRDGRLLIRTLLEKRCEDVFLNSSIARTVVDAARRTTAEDPLLPFSAQDNWYYLNPVLNEVSERFAVGAVRQDLGLDVRCETYVLCLTCEAAGLLRQRKIRAMLIREELLRKLPEEQPKLSSPHHLTRWHTLQTLSRLYTSSPDRFLTMEICQ